MAKSSGPVPACPEWTVHDVLAHLCGLCVDIVTGRLTSVSHDVDDLALGQLGSRASEGIDVAIEYLIDVIVQPAFIGFGLDPLELRIGDRAYVVASDGPATYNDDQ